MATGEKVSGNKKSYQEIKAEAKAINTGAQTANRIINTLGPKLKRDIARIIELDQRASYGYNPDTVELNELKFVISLATTLLTRAEEAYPKAVSEAEVHYLENYDVYRKMAIEEAQDPDSGITNLQVGYVYDIQRPNEAEQPTQDGAPVEVTV
jgi:hypothetical protein